MDRLVQILQENKTMELDQMLKNIRADVDKFADGAEQFDDITMLYLKYNGGNKNE